MKVRKITAGAKIEVGDRLKMDNWTGVTWFKFVRVTEKFAMVAWKNKSEGKFPRIVPEVGMRPSGKRDIWATTQYSVWRPVETENGVVS